MLSDSQIQIAIEDARARQRSLMDLILFIDKQAMALLGVYVAVSTAATGVALTTLASESLIPIPAAAGMTTAAALLLVGAIFCFLAMSPATVTLVGEGADFWLWAEKKKRASFRSSAVLYLKRLEESTTLNRELNTRSAGRLTTAKQLGLLTPVASLLVGFVVYVSVPTARYLCLVFFGT